MDNPESCANYGLLAGNSKNHGYFGQSYLFDNLNLPFKACKKCTKEILTYIQKGDWKQFPFQ
jgi:hypothetical protein